MSINNVKKSIFESNNSLFQTFRGIQVRKMATSTNSQNSQISRFQSKYGPPKYEDQTETGTKLGYLCGGLILAGGTGYYFVNRNKEDNYEDSSYTKRINTTYGYVLGGLGTTAVTAMTLARTKLPQTLMRINPWASLFGGLAVTIPFMVGTMLVDVESNPVLKHAMWLGFNGSIAGNLCTISLLGGPIIAQAAIATGCVMGGLSLVAVTSKPETFSSYHGMLGIGLGTVIAAGLGNMLFPLPVLYNVSLYGGLLVFGGLTLADTQKLLIKAKTAEKFDPVNESLSLYLDAVNIFVHIAEILFKIESKNKK
ncbi:MAG: hypothetical protein Terrestrivirus3_54 [Terrestrivirus sp.]|uniref:Growth hormone-inducible transmembrane protein n=1 Tax=Terrestrivirus sp. TaxID=2487775 RepID=A0A3G4ZLR8_9VIRU|nr:MAG: hypothetical protein Terrestrivirus3_54 [Terrestrivirus sp.]